MGTLAEREGGLRRAGGSWWLSVRLPCVRIQGLSRGKTFGQKRVSQSMEFDGFSSSCGRSYEIRWLRESGDTLTFVILVFSRQKA